MSDLDSPSILEHEVPSTELKPSKHHAAFSLLSSATGTPQKPGAKNSPKFSLTNILSKKKPVNVNIVTADAKQMQITADKERFMRDIAAIRD